MWDQHRHRPEDPTLLAVDQKLGEGAALRVAPELADRIGAVEVGEHQDTEQLGAGSRFEGIGTLTYRRVRRDARLGRLGLAATLPPNCRHCRRP